VIGCAPEPGTGAERSHERIVSEDADTLRAKGVKLES